MVGFDRAYAAIVAAMVVVSLQAGVVVRSLEGDWKFLKDGTRRDGIADVAFDDSSWATVTVPHDWAISGPFDPNASGWQGKLPWRGTAWYRKVVEIDAAEWAAAVSEKKVAYLEFDGVMARPEVWVNGIKAGGWDYGYMSFQLDVTRLLKSGANAVAVRCDTTDHGSRWYPGAGIYRSVRLVWRPENHVRPGSLSILSEVKGLRVENGKPKADVAEVKVAYESSVEGAKSFAFEIRNPRLWELDAGELYTLDLLDEKFTYGIRDFRFDPDNGFILNGRRCQLKGVDLHSDMGPLGMAYDRDVMRRQLNIMKDMGFNALRTSHNAVDPHVLELCDEMGVFVWNECFDKWNHFAGKKKSENLEDYISRNLRQFVRRDRNHPSVFCWSIGNEIGPIIQDNEPTGMTDERFRIFRAAIRELDTTRPVAIGCCSGLGKVDFSILDMAGWNYGASYRRFHAKYPKTPVLYSESASAVSEYGFYELPPAPNKTAYARDTLQVGSYDHNAAPWSDIPDHEFERMKADSYCGGEFVWTGIDYLGEPTPIARAEKFGITNSNAQCARSSYFGAVDLCGIPKDRFYIYRSHWNSNDETVHLLPHWNWKAGQNIPVYVYTSGDEAELFLNGRSLGRRRKGSLVRKNLAAGATATASSEEVKDGRIAHPASDALTDAYDRRWCACGGATNEWWQMDLGRPVAFDALTLQLEQGPSRYGYVVLLSDDGRTWREYVRQEHGKNVLPLMTRKSESARYVRILFTALEPGVYASVRRVLLNKAEDAAELLDPYYDVCSDYRLRWFGVDYEPGELKAVAYRKGRKIGEAVMRTAERPVEVRLTDDPYNPVGARTRFVQVDVVDTFGTRDPLATDDVSFSLEGPGEIVAVGNGNPKDHKVFTDVTHHPLHYGKAVAVVRRKGPGEIRLSVSAPGLLSAETILP